MGGHSARVSSSPFTDCMNWVWRVNPGSMSRCNEVRSWNSMVSEWQYKSQRHNAFTAVRYKADGSGLLGKSGIIGGGWALGFLC